MAREGCSSGERGGGRGERRRKKWLESSVKDLVRAYLHSLDQKSYLLPFLTESHSIKYIRIKIITIFEIN